MTSSSPILNAMTLFPNKLTLRDTVVRTSTSLLGELVQPMPSLIRIWTFESRPMVEVQRGGLSVGSE
jgi:hypothetical protein